MAFSPYARNQRVALAVSSLAIAGMLIALSLPRPLPFARPGDFLSLHLLLEMFAISVSVMIVTIAWNTRDKLDEVPARLMIFGFTGVAGLDTLHVLFYAGMPSLWVEGGTNTAIFFWLCGRVLEVVTVALLACNLHLPGSRSLWRLAALSLVAALLLLATRYPDWLPLSYQSGVGLTPFKNISEYLLSAANLALALHFFLLSRCSRRSHELWLGTACCVMGIGELAFTQYRVDEEFINLFGHLYKVAAYAFIYLAVFQTAVRKPYLKLLAAEQHSREQEAELQRLLGNLPVGIARFDEQLRFRYASPALLHSLDHGGIPVLGQEVDAVLLPEVAAQVRAPLRAALTGIRSDCRLSYQSLAGTPAFARCIVVPEPAGSEHGASVLAIFTDTTAQETSRQRLLESMREVGEIKAALDAHAIVAVTDARGVITQVNDKFCAISQYDRSELIGRTHRLINSGYHPRSFFQDLWRTISRGEVWSGEVCNRAKDGSLYWVQSTIVPFTGKDGRPEQYIAIRADITARKLIEEEARRLALHDELTGLPNRRLMSELSRTAKRQPRASVFRECRISRCRPGAVRKGEGTRRRIEGSVAVPGDIRGLCWHGFAPLRCPTYEHHSVSHQRFRSSDWRYFHT